MTHPRDLMISKEILMQFMKISLKLTFIVGKLCLFQKFKTENDSLHYFFQIMSLLNMILFIIFKPHLILIILKLIGNQIKVFKRMMHRKTNN